MMTFKKLIPNFPERNKVLRGTNFEVTKSHKFTIAAPYFERNPGTRQRAIPDDIGVLKVDDFANAQDGLMLGNKHYGIARPFKRSLPTTGESMLHINAPYIPDD